LSHVLRPRVNDARFFFSIEWRFVFDGDGVEFVTSVDSAKQIRQQSQSIEHVLNVFFLWKNEFLRRRGNTEDDKIRVDGMIFRNAIFRSYNFQLADIVARVALDFFTD